jgi:homoserine kinase
MRWAVAYGPACIGNLAAGFDLLGAAVAPDLAAPEEAAGEGDFGASSGAEAVSEGHHGAQHPAPDLETMTADPRLWGYLVAVAEAPAGRSGLTGGPTPAGGGPIELVCGGPYARQLPAAPADNLALRACAAFERRLGRPLPPLALRLHKGLPVGSGLGSSSATVVATLRALDAWCGHPLDAAALLGAAGEAEAHASGAPHLDNVAAALLGGLRLVDPCGGAPSLPFPAGLRFVLAVPQLTLTTRTARAVLPPAVPLAVAVAHAQNLACLVQALHAGQHEGATRPESDAGAAGELLRACLRDLLAEPYRAPLVPGFRAVQSAALAAGAWACTFSGAGPSIFAVAQAAAAPAVGAAMRHAWQGAGVASRWRICTLDPRGARVLAANPCA